MNYMGGKHRQGPTIARYIQRVMSKDKWYVEPFCGAMGVASKVAHTKMLLADVSQSLMTMWDAVINQNVELPDEITEQTYNELKLKRDPNDWTTAYVGFGMSFGSKYFGGYARAKVGKDAKRIRSKELQKSTTLKRDAIKLQCKELILKCSHYKSLEIPDNSVIYCDPPYAGRTKAHNSEPFDHPDFYNWIRNQVDKGHILILTEFQAPEDFTPIYTFGDTVVRHYSGKGTDGTQERIFVHQSQTNLFR